MSVRFLNALVRLLDRLVDVGLVLAVTSVVAMTLLMTTEVVVRTVFRVSTQMAVEMSSYLLVSMAALGLAHVARTNGFIRVEMLYERYSPRGKRIAGFVLHLLAAVYSGLLVYFVARYVWRSYELGTTSIFISEIPVWIPQTPLALGLLLLAAEMTKQTILAWMRLWRGEDVPDQEGPPAGSPPLPQQPGR